MFRRDTNEGYHPDQAMPKRTPAPPWDQKALDRPTNIQNGPATDSAER